MEVVAGSLTQLQSLDELAQHAGQSLGRLRGPPQLLVLLLDRQGSRQDIVRAGDDLQWLAQIVTGHRQQRRGEIAVSLICVAAYGTTYAPRVPTGGRHGSNAVKNTDRLHLPVLL
jgi:hypothetical protein